MAIVKQVIHGQVTLEDTVLTVDATLNSAIDLSKSFLVFGVEQADNTPEEDWVRGQIINTTTLRFTRTGTSSANNDIIIRYHVVEFESGVAVQRGTLTNPSSGANNISLSTSIDLSKSIALISASNTGSSLSDDEFYRAELPSTSTLRITVVDGNANDVVEWQVIEFADSAVQSGTVNFGTSDTVKTVILPTTVDASKSWLSLSYSSDSGTGSDLGQKMVRGDLSTDGTTLTFTRENSGQALDLSYFVVEFTDETTVQRSTATLSSAELDDQLSLTTIDPDHSLPILAGLYDRMGSTAFSSNDTPGVSSAHLALNGAGSELTIRRGLDDASASFVWQVIEFEAQATNTTTWTLAIDWQRTGTFDGAHDDITSYVLNSNWFLGFRKPYQDVADDNMLELVLNNADRRFSPENSGSPLAGWVAPYRPVRVQSFDGTSTRTHFSGWIESVEPGVNQYGERQVKITCAGAMLFFKNVETNIELQEQKRTDEIIEVLLDEITIPPSLEDDTTTGKQSAILDYPGSNLDEIVFADIRVPRTLQAGRTTLPYAADNWVKQGGSPDEPRKRFNVYHAIKDVTAAERGRFFFDRDGEAQFWNRHELLLNQTVVATFDNSMSDLSYNFAGLDEFKNDIQVSYHPRKLSDGDNILLAELVYDPENPKEGITLRGSEEQDIHISYQDENANRVGAKDVYVASVKWAGGATEVWIDKNGNQGVNYIDAYPGTLTLIPKANGAILRIRANQISTLLAYEIRGRGVIDMGEKEMTAKDGLSITQYGQRSLVMNLPSLQHNEVARDIANFELARRKQPTGKVASMTLRSHGKKGDALHHEQLKLTIGDRVRVQEAQSGHDAEYFIIGEAHRLSDSATMFETTWYLESATESNWAILDTTELDGEGVDAPERAFVLAY